MILSRIRTTDVMNDCDVDEDSGGDDEDIDDC